MRVGQVSSQYIKKNDLKLSFTCIPDISDSREGERVLNIIRNCMYDLAKGQKRYCSCQLAELGKVG